MDAFLRAYLLDNKSLIVVLIISIIVCIILVSIEYDSGFSWNNQLILIGFLLSLFATVVIPIGLIYDYYKQKNNSEDVQNLIAKYSQ